MTLTVVLTREPPRNDDLRSALSARARVLEVPLTTTTYREIDDVATDIASLDLAGQFATVVLTSERAARYLPAALAHAREDAVIGVVGPATQLAVAAVAPGRRVLRPTTASAQALGALIETGPVLVLRAALVRDELADELDTTSLDRREVVAYTTNACDVTGFTCEQLRLADVLVVAAPSAWLVARDEIRRHCTVVAIGATTASAVLADHDRVVVARDDLVGSVAAVIDDLEGDVVRRPR